MYLWKTNVKHVETIPPATNVPIADMNQKNRPQLAEAVVEIGIWLNA